MSDYKKAAAAACMQFLRTGQTIGLGAGTTIAHFIDLVCLETDLVKTLSFVSSSFKTRAYLKEKGLRIAFSSVTDKLDIYFDGCDQFDQQLNALKSGGGIHTSEKVLASMADEFILLGDEGKFALQLDHTYPLVIEILPEALPAVMKRLSLAYPEADIKLRTGKEKDGAVISDNGNLLADIWFTVLPDLSVLNVTVKMIPGVVEHSLFYGLATAAVIAGENGVRKIMRQNLPE